MENKSIKQYAKEAKRRLKSGFWQNHESEVEFGKQKAVSEGVAVSKVVEYYSDKRRRVVNETLTSDDEKFYKKVKRLLDEHGDAGDIIGRLTDKKQFAEMNYEQRQRYLMELSNKYLTALERYQKEQSLIGIM